jgi:aspartate racemase
MSKHIGIVACSVPGAALCYETISLEGEKYLGQHMYPEVSMHNHPLGEYLKFIEKDDQQGVAALMLDSAQKLARIGVDFLICPDNTIHEALPLLEKETPLDWLHIAEVVAHEAAQHGFGKCAVLGTKYLMKGPVYPDAFAAKGIAYQFPEPNQRERINTIIFKELVRHIKNPESEAFFLQVIEQLKQEGCDAVVLGCTEIPLIITDTNSPIPVLDSTRLLARRAVEVAVGKDN